MKKNRNIKFINLFYIVIILTVCFNIVFLAITGRHLISNQNIAAYATNRITKTIISPASRGEIFSGDGKVIATNVQRYKMIAIVSPTRGTYNGKLMYVEDATSTAELIAPIIGMEVDELEYRLQNAINNNKYQVEFGSYGNDLSSIIKDEIDGLNLPGIIFEEIITRNYPLGDFASYLVGYSQNTEQPNGSIVDEGKMGLELLYNSELAGVDGFSRFQSDIYGYTLPNGMIEEVSAIDGSDIYLTIHSTLQRDLDLELSSMVERAGATMATAVVMEADTGKILAVSNVPSFDPNVREFTNYTDYFFKMTYEVGSVFKPFVYASAIEDGVYNGDDTFESGTYMIYDDIPVRDWNSGEGWGSITYDQGLTISSNVAIANIIDNKIDKDVLIDYYEQLKFFESSNIDGVSSPSGVAGYENAVGKVEFINTGFGQGSTATALQMVRAYSVFANDGRMVEPYFIDKIVNEESGVVSYVGTTEFSHQIYSTDTIDYMNDLLFDTVNGDFVSSTRYKMDDIELIGKTGTAQVASSSGGYSTNQNISSFAGLAPYDDPKVIVYVTMDAPKYTNESSAHALIAELTQTMVKNSLAVLETTSDVTDDLLSYQIDNYTNQSVEYVTKQLQSKGINVITVGEGKQVVLQEPQAGTIVAVGDKIFLKTDEDDKIIPDFTGWSKKDVLTYCLMAGIGVEVSGDNGLVIEQNIVPGTSVDGINKVSIIVE